MNRLLVLAAFICASALMVTDLWDVSDPHQAGWLGASLAFCFASILMGDR